MAEDFYCMFCRGPMAGKRKRSALFCSLECKNSALAARRQAATLQRRNTMGLLVHLHAEWLTSFHQQLLTWAPAEAGGYQAGLWTGAMTYWFPSLAVHRKERNTLLRTRSPHPFFTLVPFEPPTVPLITVYEIRFVHRFPPHQVLAERDKDWVAKIPFAVPIRELPFRLRAVPRNQR